MSYDLREKPINPDADRTWADTVTRACICGNTTFRAVVTFDDEGNIAGYFTEGQCYDCDRWVKLPTPLDTGLPV